LTWSFSSLSCSTSENLARHRSECVSLSDPCNPTFSIIVSAAHYVFPSPETSLVQLSLETHINTVFRFHPVSKPGQVSPSSTVPEEKTVAETPTVGMPMISGPNPRPSYPIGSSQVGNFTEIEGSTSKKGTTERRTNPTKHGSTRPQRLNFPPQYPPMPIGWSMQPQPTTFIPSRPLAPGPLVYPNPSFVSPPFFPPNGPPQSFSHGAIPQGPPNMMMGSSLQRNFTNSVGNAYGPRVNMPMGGAQNGMPPITQTQGCPFAPGVQPLNGNICPPVGVPHLPGYPINGPSNGTRSTPPFPHNMGRQPVAPIYNGNIGAGQTNNQQSPHTGINR
jgi:hypothetical protein